MWHLNVCAKLVDYWNNNRFLLSIIVPKSSITDTKLVTKKTRKMLRFTSFCPTLACTIPECYNNWESLIPLMERECTEPILYVIFGKHTKWSYHGNGSMQVKGKKSICEQCESMPDMKRANLKGGVPKVKQVKLQIMLTKPLNDFLSPGGTYKTFYGRCSNTRSTLSCWGQNLV